MVEIVRRGTHPSEKIYDAECPWCKSWLRFKRGEARVTNDRQDTVLVITCPVCATSVWKSV